VRFGDSKNSSVAGRAANSASRLRRAIVLGGRKPRKSTASVGRPAALSAVIAEEGLNGDDGQPRRRGVDDQLKPRIRNERCARIRNMPRSLPP
jgi:hypothetical protein